MLIWPNSKEDWMKLKERLNWPTWVDQSKHWINPEEIRGGGTRPIILIELKRAAHARCRCAAMCRFMAQHRYTPVSFGIDLTTMGRCAAFGRIDLTQYQARGLRRYRSNYQASLDSGTAAPLRGDLTVHKTTAYLSKPSSRISAKSVE